MSENINMYCLCYKTKNVDYRRIKSCVKAKKFICIICNYLICENCNKDLENKIFIKDNYFNFKTVCILCISNFLIKSKNFDTMKFYKKTQLFLEDKISLLEYNSIEESDCKYCLNFVNNINNDNYTFKYLKDLNYFNLIINNIPCFNNNCYTCVSKLFKINKSNKKFLSIILIRLNKTLHSPISILKVNRNIFSYSLNRKIILEFNDNQNQNENEKNLNQFLIIVKKDYNIELSENYTKYFKIFEIRKIKNFIEILKSITSLYYTNFWGNSINYNNEPSLNYKQRNFVQKIIEYVEDKDIDFFDYKFYFQYSLKNPALKKYLSNKNNFKHLKNFDLFNNIYSNNTHYKKIIKIIRNKLETENYKYVVTMDIRKAYNSINVNHPIKEKDNLIDIMNYVSEEMFQNLKEFFNTINKYKRNKNLPVSQISAYIFIFFMYQPLQNYKKNNIIIFCDDIMLFGNSIDELISDIYYIFDNFLTYHMYLNLNKLRFFNLEKQNLFFLNHYIYPSKSLKNIINIWKDKTYCPNSKVFYKLKEKFENINL